MHSITRRNFVGALGAGAALSTLHLTRVPAARAADSQPPVTKGLRLFFTGHSFHMFVVRLLDEIAEKAGIEGQKIVGKSGIGGSRVIQHWDVADEKNEAKRLLSEGKIDVLTLAPIWLPDEGIQNFVHLGLEHNPKLRITIQEFWLPNDEYHPVYPLEVRKGCDHNATSLVELQKAQDAYDHDLGAVVKDLNKEAGKNAVFLVPVGQAAIALREKIVAGKAPGLKEQADLFRDPWGHPTAALQLLSAYCHFAVFYRRTPVGIPVISILETLKDVSDDDKEKLNLLLQELAWNAVTEHPLSGVSRESE
ncbi:MAG TPA: hypothetical protein VHV77_04970 [Pirellulales bacterium]|nr:hypothetical protein [Pirellulales bacterium]